MIILRRFLRRKADMETLSTMLSRSLAIASAEGASHAGAQHLMLAALEMEDGSARRAFAAIGADSNQFSAAIAAQKKSALPGLDTVSPGAGETIAPSKPKLDATYDAAVRATHDFHNAKENGGPLCGAYVVAGIASIPRGTAARALAAMNVNAEALIEAALAEARPR